MQATYRYMFCLNMRFKVLYASQPALDPYLSSLEENGRQTQAMVGCQVCQGRCGSPLPDRTPRSGDWMGTRQHPHVDPVP